MKITKKQLMQIIKEELESAMEAATGQPSPKVAREQKPKLVTREESIASWTVILSGNEVSEGGGVGARELIDFLEPFEDPDKPETLEAYRVRIEAVGWGMDYPEMSGTKALALAKADWYFHPQNTKKPRPKRSMDTYFDGSDYPGGY